jgi:hypothetical protein
LIHVILLIVTLAVLLIGAVIFRSATVSPQKKIGDKKETPNKLLSEPDYLDVQFETLITYLRNKMYEDEIPDNPVILAQVLFAYLEQWARDNAVTYSGEEAVPDWVEEAFQ